jgi:hypothetical protein
VTAQVFVVPLVADCVVVQLHDGESLGNPCVSGGDMGHAILPKQQPLSDFTRVFNLPCRADSPAQDSRYAKYASAFLVPQRCKLPSSSTVSVRPEIGKGTLNDSCGVHSLPVTDALEAINHCTR